MDKSKIILAIGLFFLFCSNISAQLYELGVHSGYIQSNLKPEGGQLTNTVFIQEGRPAGGYKVGMQYSIGEPKDQMKAGWDPRYGISAEASFCSCGGNYSATRSGNKGQLSLLNLKYRFYRLDVSPKFTIRSKMLRLSLGPVVSSITYAGFNTDQEEETISATSDFSSIIIGYEAGVGFAYRKFNVSLRHLRYVTNYGISYRGNAMETKNSEISVVIGLTLKQKHKGAYWDSINWGK